MCIQLQEFFETCCHMTERLLSCDPSSPCPAAKVHVFTDYLTSGICVFCTGRRTRLAIANLRKEVTLVPNVIPIPEDQQERLREEWRDKTKTFRKKRHIRDDIMEPMAVKDIDKERMTCTYCWRQYDGKGDDCCEHPKKLFCGHIFGQRCILEWLFSSGKHWCPTCRKGFERPREGGPKNKRNGVILDGGDWSALMD